MNWLDDVTVTRCREEDTVREKKKKKKAVQQMG